MMKCSQSVKNRVNREVLRAIGSCGVLVFYNGPVPSEPEDEPRGNKISSRPMSDADMVWLCHPELGVMAPEFPKGATYWRILDNGGLVVLQDDYRP